VTSSTQHFTPAPGWLERHVPLNPPDSTSEEIASATTHGLGAVASAIGLVLLITRASSLGTTTTVLGMTVFGLSMVLLYAASCLYHSARDPSAKRLCRVIDHGSIYLLIAGTYTPVMLMLGGVWGWSILGVVWTCAGLGILLELFKMKKSKLASLAVYVAMGWVIILAWPPLKAVADPRLLHWMLAGGVTYTVGTVFYALKSLKYHHAIWHLFVLGGSTFFWIGIYAYCCG
jgi:hemolysin III